MKYIASCSGGKDSVATVILAHENNEPLDLILFSEVMYDENISGELPEHIEFIKNVLFPTFESWGYKTKILHSNKTYLDCFHHKATKGKRIGMKLGFPMSGKCKINDECKIKPIKDFYKKINEPVLQYIGIAIDEPERLSRIKSSDDKMSLLEKYGYTEKMAFELCKEYDLLSPAYNFSFRGGCWFCPNARKREMQHLRKHHKELWNKLLELENETNLIGNVWNILSKVSIHDLEREFAKKETTKLRLIKYLENKHNLFKFKG